ncbi:MAG: enoyl-CoA hydratase/isomerase family protein [Myxococcales bacterium]|nr:enoyl-CoA hydratase/isomerase family protein [Myxococcales bacterium]HIK84811.1 enoyl-CoA hydratase/isomerase family protein [Myxococcales bacterium]
MADSLIRLEMDDGVAVLTNDRPEKHNAANDEMDRQLFDALEEIQRHPDLRVVLWRGEGKSFSSGRDTSELGVRSEDISHFDFVERGHRRSQIFFDLPVPLVVALKGWVIGGSFERALLADIRIAADNTKMVLPEIQHGVVPDSGGTARLFQMAGHGLVSDLAMTGRVMEAEEALRHGVVSRVVPEAELEEASMTLCREIAAQPPFAIRMFRRTLARMANPLPKSTMQEESMAMAAIFETADYLEMKKSRAEGRAPAFKGR